MSRGFQLLRASLVATIITFYCVAFAQQASRFVVVNGQLLTPPQLAQLDHTNCNTPVPDGRYWINWQTLYWGFEDGPKEGMLGDCALLKAPPAEAI